MKARFKFIYILLHLVSIAVLAIYLQVKIYNWPEPAPFEGEVWYNPYDGALGNRPLKANFHGHTKSWFGLTFGENTEEELTSAYAERGYDIIGISNYQNISTYLDTSPLYIPLYEHGVNVPKVHNLPIGATKVLLPLYPVHFTLHQAQQMLVRTAAISSLNALCHPTMSRISPQDVSRLTGYSLLEVGNTLGMSVEHWDSALSSGRLIWILANDDTHGLTKEPTFIKWNIIFADSPDAASAMEAMRSGVHYGVESYFGDCENYTFRRFDISGDTLHIRISDQVNRIDLYGQGGILVKQVSRTDRTAYLLSPGDTYVRAEIHMDDCVYYSNPIVRTTDGTPPLAAEIAPTMAPIATWLTRILISLLIILIGYRTYRIAKK